MLTFAVVVLMLIFVFGILQVFAVVQSTKATNSIIDKSPGFTKRFVSPDGQSSIAIDRTNGLVHLSDGSGSAAVTFDQLISSEVVQNGTSVTKTNRGNMIGRALVGGVLTGGVGAIIGGVTASKINYSKGSIELHVITTMPNMPFVSIGFLQIQKDQNSSTYKVFLKEALTWHGEISAAIKLTESAFQDALPVNQLPSTNQEESASYLIPDRLDKLAKLKSEGHITTKEFSVAKAQLLGTQLLHNNRPENNKVSSGQHGVEASNSISNASWLDSVQALTQKLRENILNQRKSPNGNFWIDVGAPECVLQICSANMLIGEIIKNPSALSYSPGLIISMPLLDENDEMRFRSHPNRLQFVNIGTSMLPIYCCIMGADVSATMELTLNLLGSVFGIPKQTNISAQAFKSS